MSTDQPHEIVIIKRYHDEEEEGHHGGAWKIAFADFMSAMMALFLVLWLISASNKSKLAIARYFNPIKLSEMTKSPQGLYDTNDVQPPSGNAKDGASDVPKDNPVPETGDSPAQPGKEPGAKYSEEQLFKDPFAILAKIAAQAAKPDESATTIAKSQTQAETFAEEVHGFSDPFVPPKDMAVPAAAVTKKPSAPASTKTPAPAAPSAPPPADKVSENIAPSSDSAHEAETAKIRLAVEQIAAQSDGNIQVSVTAEGTLISVTEGADFPMFASASAEPQPKLVQFMTKIGEVLKKANSPIIVRGFTDQRPFRSDNYDNWRLSSDRANMARLMLQRGGVAEKLFERVEGHADRELKNPAHPEMPENRRIEILLQNKKP